MKTPSPAEMRPRRYEEHTKNAASSVPRFVAEGHVEQSVSIGFDARREAPATRSHASKPIGVDRASAERSRLPGSSSCLRVFVSSWPKVWQSSGTVLKACCQLRRESI